MYGSEKLDENIARRIISGQDTREYKVGPHNRIVFAQYCQHCNEQFFPKRRNHKYCSSSCRALACYKRKNYKYQSGRYVKPSHEMGKIGETDTPLISPNTFDWQNFKESALASAATETAKYLLHDRHVLHEIKEVSKKLDHLTSTTVIDKRRNLQYVGLKTIGNSVCSVFKDLSTQSILINDPQNNWYLYKDGKLIKHRLL